LQKKTPFAHISTCHEYTKPHAAYTDMDANQSVQDGREGEAEDVVEDGEGGEYYWRGAGWVQLLWRVEGQVYSMVP
jgi:hypothetical protein